MKRIVILLFLLHFCFGLDLFSQSRQYPNIIVILADDLGTGDLSTYNETSQTHTPNIGKLAGEGIRFTKAHSNSSVCTEVLFLTFDGRELPMKNSVRLFINQMVIHARVEYLIRVAKIWLLSRLEKLIMNHNSEQYFGW